MWTVNSYSNGAFNVCRLVVIGFVGTVSVKIHNQNRIELELTCLMCKLGFNIDIECL